MEDFIMQLLEQLANPDDGQYVEERRYLPNVKAMKIWFEDSATDMREALKDGNKKFNSGDYKGAKKSYEIALKKAKEASAELNDIDHSLASEVTGVLLWGWYFAAWLIIGKVVAEATTPEMKTFEIPDNEIKKMKAECSKGYHGVQKSIGKVLGKIIAFCQYRIKKCDKGGK